MWERRATWWAYGAGALEPIVRSLTRAPDRYRAVPSETWMMPSLSASARPARAALRVCELVKLIDGRANPRAFAVSIMGEYFSGVARGTLRRYSRDHAGQPQEFRRLNVVSITLRSNGLVSPPIRAMSMATASRPIVAISCAMAVRPGWNRSLHSKSS